MCAPVLFAAAGDLTVNRQNYFMFHTNTNPGGTSDALIILSAVVGTPTFLESTLSEIIDSQELTIAASMTTPPLFYPSPFRLEDGSELGYKLSKDMPVSIRIYDMRGNQVFVEHIGTGDLGGRIGYNYVPFTEDMFTNGSLPAGPYFYLLLSDGDLLGKGKFAILP